MYENMTLWVNFAGKFKNNIYMSQEQEILRKQRERRKKISAIREQFANTSCLTNNIPIPIRTFLNSQSIPIPIRTDLGSANLFLLLFIRKITIR